MLVSVECDFDITYCYPKIKNNKIEIFALGTVLANLSMYGVKNFRIVVDDGVVSLVLPEIVPEVIKTQKDNLKTAMENVKVYDPYDDSRDEGYNTSKKKKGKRK